ncbi:MAG: hypothetical protein ACK4MV_16340 [Beijerinckiaceae bacterium]
MKQSRASSRHLSADERTVVADRIVAFLRDRHPAKMPENVEADTGIPAETVSQWEQRGSAPSIAAAFRLFNAYGPEFLVAAMGDSAPDWLRKGAIAAEIEQRQRVLEEGAQRIEELRAMLAK